MSFTCLVRSNFNCLLTEKKPKHLIERNPDPTFRCFFSFSSRSIRSRRSLSSSSRSSSVSGLMLLRLTITSRISSTRTTLGISLDRASQPYWSMMRSNSWPTTAAMSYTSITVRSATFFSRADPESSMTGNSGPPQFPIMFPPPQQTSLAWNNSAKLAQLYRFNGVNYEQIHRKYA